MKESSWIAASVFQGTGAFSAVWPTESKQWRTMHKQENKYSLWTMLPNNCVVSWVNADRWVILFSDDIAHFHFWHNDAIQKLSNLFAVTQTHDQHLKKNSERTTALVSRELNYVI